MKSWVGPAAAKENRGERDWAVSSLPPKWLCQFHERVKLGALNQSSRQCPDQAEGGGRVTSCHTRSFSKAAISSRPAPPSRPWGQGFALTFLLLVPRGTQLEELQDVLEKLQSKRISTWEKKYNQVPKVPSGPAPACSDSMAKGSMWVTNAPAGQAQCPAVLRFHFSACPAELAARSSSRCRPGAAPWLVGPCAALLCSLGTGQ